MDWREETEAERQLRRYYNSRDKKLIVRARVEVYEDECDFRLNLR